MAIGFPTAIYPDKPVTTDGDMPTIHGTNSGGEEIQSAIENVAWAQVIGSTGSGIVPSSLKDRFKHTCNAVTDLGLSTFPTNNTTALQGGMDKVQAFDGAIWFPPPDNGQKYYNVGHLETRQGTIGGVNYDGTSVALIGWPGLGASTRGGDGRFDHGVGLKLLAHTNDTMITSKAKAGHLKIENLELEMNYSEQDTLDFHGIDFEDRTDGSYGYAGSFKTVRISSAGKSGLRIGSNRGEGTWNELWIQYCRGYSGNAALACLFADQEFDQWGIGSNLGTGAYFGSTAQVHIRGGACFLNNVNVQVDSGCQSIAFIGTAFDSPSHENVTVNGYSGTAVKASRMFVGCNFRNSSLAGSGTYSDLKVDGAAGEAGVILSSVHFQGPGAKYHIETANGAVVFCGPPLRYSSTGGTKSFVTDFTNDYTKVIMGDVDGCGWRRDGSGNIFIRGNGKDLIKIGDGSAFNFMTLQPDGTTTTRLDILGKNNGGVKLGGAAEAVGFYGNAGAVKGTITGAKGGNVALANLLTYLASLGVLTDSST